MAAKKLGRNDWIQAARLALLRGGPDAVKVETLAAKLGVTKGSFYWHFNDRGELLEALLQEWEKETSTLLGDALVPGVSRVEAIASLMKEIRTRVVLSERGESPSDAAIFAWAAISPLVARRVNRVEKQRIDLLTKITGGKDPAELFYYAFIGFIMRRSRVPALTQTFPRLSLMLSGILAPKRNGKPNVEDQ